MLQPPPLLSVQGTPENPTEYTNEYQHYCRAGRRTNNLPWKEVGRISSNAGHSEEIRLELSE
jgi:hypothetical protein